MIRMATISSISQHPKSIIELRPLNYYMQLLPSSVCILKAEYIEYWSEAKKTMFLLLQVKSWINKPENAPWFSSVHSSPHFLSLGVHRGLYEQRTNFQVYFLVLQPGDSVQSCFSFWPKHFMQICEKHNPSYTQSECPVNSLTIFIFIIDLKVLIIDAIPLVATGHCDQAAWSYHLVNTSGHNMFLYNFSHLIFNVSRQRIFFLDTWTLTQEMCHSM